MIPFVQHPHDANSAIVQQIVRWFHNRCRAASAKGRGDLKLDAGDKRKLAPVQAYCSYAWESTLRRVVLKRWNEQKATMVCSDDDDPPEDAEGPPEEVCIPLSFKLQIAKEYYEKLSDEEKKEIDRRREEDRGKLYRTISQIPEDSERIAKLAIHKGYCASN